MLLRHHGIIVIGPNCAEALEDLYYFEKSAKLQCELSSMGQDPKDCAMSNEMAESMYKSVQEYPERTRTAYALFNAWK